MSKRLTRIKRTFFLYQIMILVCALGLFLGVIANGYITNAKTEIRLEQEQMMDFIVEYVQRGEQIPEIAKELAIYFILDAQDGSYVTRRKDEGEQGGLFWETFRSKLTYQMQKQKNGSISYPFKEPTEVLKDSKVLQYKTLDERGWIVITEVDLPSEWALLKKVTTKQDLFNLLLGIFIGFVLLKFSTDIYFVRLEAQISDTHEYSLGNFNQNIGKGSTKASKLRKRTPKTNMNIEPKALPKKEVKKPMDFSEKALGANVDVKPVSYLEPPVEHVAPEEPETVLERPKETDEEVFKAQPQKIQEVKKEHVPPSAPRQENRSRVNIQEIKSPVLKKMIEELREQKKRG